MTRSDNDTIAAIATPLGESGIGIVRMSGKDALKIADMIFLSRKRKKPSEFKTYTLHYGWVISDNQVTPSLKLNIRYDSPDMDRQIIDEVILTIMRAPKSYTKEDVVEINCHGGIVAMRAVLDLVLNCGARLAEPGEFTRRAFLNGRIDLAQAEAVLDIIRAKTDSALKVGLTQLRGQFTKEIRKMRTSLLEMLSQLEAHIDFPEEEMDSLNLKDIYCRLEQIQQELERLIQGSRKGRILREGIHAVICGKPNAGKSSLLNALLKQERSIVTAVAGTTRDTIEEIIDIKGIPIRFVDTAGIIEPRDLIERKALQRTREQIKRADLLIFVFDGSTRLDRNDWTLVKKLKHKPTLAVINKIDLRQKIEKVKIMKTFPRVIEFSAKKSINLNLLEDTVVSLVNCGEVDSPESLTVTNFRHIEILKEIQKLVAQTFNSLDNKLSLEFVAQDIKGALSGLDELSGENFSEDLLDRIFKDFCIGK